jgi:hypothetical protein
MSSINQGTGISCGVCNLDLFPPLVRFEPCGHNIHEVCYNKALTTGGYTCCDTLTKTAGTNTNCNAIFNDIQQLSTRNKLFATFTPQQKAVCAFHHYIKRNTALGTECAHQMVRNRFVSLSDQWEGLSPLFRAIYSQNKEAAKYLIMKGADINGVSNKQLFISYSPLKAAIGEKLPRIVEYLVNKGANVNEKDEDGFTALHQAALQGNAQIVSYLLQKGAKKSIDGLWLQKCTPLSLAVDSANLDTVKVLVKAGADLTHTYDIVGRNIYDYAVKVSIENKCRYEDDTPSPRITEIIQGGEAICRYLSNIESLRPDLLEDLFSV